VQILLTITDFLVYFVLGLLIYLLIAYAILSWLIAFNVVNTYNPAVRGISTTLGRLLEPLLRPIRRILPEMGGIDLSPMVLWLLIILIQRLYPVVVRSLAVPAG